MRCTDLKFEQATFDTMVLCPLRLSLIVGAIRFMTVLANCGGPLTNGLKIINLP